MGKWFIQLKGEIMGAGFLADGKGQSYNYETGQWETTGTWSYENGILTAKEEGRESKFSASLYNGKSVLVMKEADDDLGNYTVFFYKEGKSSASDASVLQGTWDWFAFGPGMPRIRFVFSGSNFDLIIPVWGDRYKGSYSYDESKQVLSITNAEQICRGNAAELGDNSTLTSNLFNDWPGATSADHISLGSAFEMPFKVSGDKATCKFVGLELELVRKK